MQDRAIDACDVEDFEIAADGGPLALRRVVPPGGARPDSPVLVFLHEALGCIGMWRDVPQRLAAMTGLEALVYDRHGHGRSGPMPAPRRPGYLEREAFDVLPAVLDACAIDAPVLVGHSDGGSIALLYASRHRARAVVAEAAHVYVEAVTRAGIREAVQAWRETDLPARLARHHGDKTEALFAAWADVWLSDEFRDWNIEDCLPRIACPVLVIQGADDEYATAAHPQSIAAGVAGDARVMMVPGCRHIPHFQAADRVLPAIAEFAAPPRPQT